MPIIREGTSRGSHVRAVRLALLCMLDRVYDRPEDAQKRVAIRNHLAALQRAYAAELNDDVELAQWLAEEDGDAVSEAP